MSGYVLRSYPSLNCVEMPKLSWKQRLVLHVNGSVFLRYDGKPRFRRPTAIFLLKCKFHGYFEDYEHGYNGYFQCRKCLAEAVTDSGLSVTTSILSVRGQTNERRTC